MEDERSATRGTLPSDEEVFKMRDEENGARRSTARRSPSLKCGKRRRAGNSLLVMRD